MQEYNNLITEFDNTFNKCEDALSPYAEETCNLCKAWIKNQVIEALSIISDFYECDASHVTHDITALIENTENILLRQKLEELKQQVNLEVARFSVMARLLQVSNLSELNDRFEDMRTKLNLVQDQQQSMTAHYITILGIFAAIVLGATSITSMSKTMLELVGSSDLQRCTLFYIIYTMFCLDVIYFLVNAFSRNRPENRILTLSNIVALIANIGLLVLIIKL